MFMNTIRNIMLQIHFRSFRSYRSSIGNKNIPEAVKKQFHIMKCCPMFMQRLLIFVHDNGCITSAATAYSYCSLSTKMFANKNENNKTNFSSCYIDASLKSPILRRHQFTVKPVNYDELRILSYNVLCQLYTKTALFKSYLSPTLPEIALDEKYRQDLLLHEIKGYNADIMCLQEVGEEAYNDVYYPNFIKSSYEGIYAIKENNVMEGCATFYRRDKFNFLGSKKYFLGEEVQNNESLIHLWEALKQDHEFCERVISRPNILQVVLLQNKHCPSMIIVVASTHLYAKPSQHNIRVLQSYIAFKLLKEVIKIYAAECPNHDIGLLFCGDFNSLPDEPPYKFISSKISELQDPTWSSDLRIALGEMQLSHDFDMDSACGLPEYTNYVHGFNGCIDYILYQKDKFSVKQIIPLPSHEEVTANGSLPSIQFPSDHLALIADLKVNIKR